MAPSEAATAAGAPVEVGVSQVAPGTLLTAEWRGKPVWIVHRTGQMLDVLGKFDDQLVDPQARAPQQPAYSQNATRSYRPQAAPADLGSDWPGGFSR